MTVNVDVFDESAPVEPLRFDHPGQPRRPEDDPFHTPPRGWEATAPGAILHTRPVTIAAFGLVRQSFTAWQLLYRTTDLDDRPDTTVVTVLVPEGVAGRPERVLSFQCAIDAVSSQCFPSYALRQGARALGAVPQFEIFLMGAALDRGWVVAVPDHEGMLGVFGAPREPGYRSLDGIRATLGFDELGLDPATPVGLFGYSGGGMATSWTAEMAGTYAPELTIVGAAAGSPVGDPASTFLRLNGSVFSGLPGMVVAGLRRVSPALDTALRDATPDAQRRLTDLTERTTVGAVLRAPRMDWDTMTAKPLADVLAEPEIVELMRSLQLGLHAPTMPMLVVQSVADPLISVDDVDGQVQRYRAAGAHVTYLRDRLSEHITLAVFAAPLMFDWLDDRFAGRSLPESTTSTVTTVLTRRGTVPGLLRFLRVCLRMLGGRGVPV
ncbi:lipase family protein [Nocardia mangyaensis]|uniref:lipase family protein n=1 Tax=Nocardia mangyaensis TaxID=2213200 RepID=UPI002674A3DA|nr:lipase family protein [Nocardia mangyaensis]MDO3648593.1 lipase family protein [Nocardia mangyaensis]